MHNKLFARTFKNVHALLLLATLTVGSLAFASVASADCAFGCPSSGSGGNNNGNNRLSTFTIGGGVTLDGFGAAKFEGQTGGSNTDLEGSGKSAITLKAGGNGCTVNCGSLSYTLDASAKQGVNASAWAESMKAGQQATAITTGTSWTSGTLEIKRPGN